MVDFVSRVIYLKEGGLKLIDAIQTAWAITRAMATVKKVIRRAT